MVAGLSGGGIYCASKRAVDAITCTLRLELVSTKINVTSIDPRMVETEFSVVRFYGDKAKADAVYKGIEPLTGQDVAELVVFVASRKPHVNVANVLLLPTNQAAQHLSSAHQRFGRQTDFKHSQMKLHSHNYSGATS
ncbi:hypothetical protein HK100_001656 [Physocladia obscura]|uniref:Uncharacterized protein n=1 Tax=Physocladia obscura TaxID=109957 RepID=A0AAD5XEQ9_9FUNG|nr:hypothetical protein HK100_001656 [Physocladia obscura]